MAAPRAELPNSSVSEYLDSITAYWFWTLCSTLATDRKQEDRPSAWPQLKHSWDLVASSNSLPVETVTSLSEDSGGTVFISKQFQQPGTQLWFPERTQALWISCSRHCLTDILTSWSIFDQVSMFQSLVLYWLPPYLSTVLISIIFSGVLFGSKHKVKNDVEVASEIEFSTYGSHHQLLPKTGEMNVAFLSVTDFITITEIKKPSVLLSKRLSLVIAECWIFYNFFTYILKYIFYTETKNSTFCVKRLYDRNINYLVFRFSS